MTETKALFAGLKVIEAGGIGPAPYCAMLFADLGADVATVMRPGASTWPNPVTNRGKTTVMLDLQAEEGRDRLAELSTHADVLIEGFRPGVMERLGLGPDQLRAGAPRLVYGRLTGWGQTGPLAARAGHDIDYIAVAGMLGLMAAPGGSPMPPLNIVGDYAGGALMLAFAIATALYRRTFTGKGATIDASILDGTASLLAPQCGYAATGFLDPDPTRSMLGGTAPLYRAYTCADGRSIAIGCLEPQFRKILAEQLDVPLAMFDDRDPARWAEIGAALSAVFATRTREAWVALLGGVDSCAAPVMMFDELADHPQTIARGTYFTRDDIVQPGLPFRLAGDEAGLAIRPACEASPDELIAAWQRDASA